MLEKLVQRAKDDSLTRMKKHLREMEELALKSKKQQRGNPVKPQLNTDNSTVTPIQSQVEVRKSAAIYSFQSLESTAPDKQGQINNIKNSSYHPQTTRYRVVNKLRNSSNTNLITNINIETGSFHSNNKKMLTNKSVNNGKFLSSLNNTFQHDQLQVKNRELPSTLNHNNQLNISSLSMLQQYQYQS